MNSVQTVFVKGDDHNLTVQKMVALSNAGSHSYIKKSAKRVPDIATNAKLGYPLAFPAEEQFLIESIKKNFEQGELFYASYCTDVCKGVATTKVMVEKLLRSHYIGEKRTVAFDSLLSNSKRQTLRKMVNNINLNSRFSTWLGRALKRHNLCNR